MLCLLVTCEARGFGLSRARQHLAAKIWPWEKRARAGWEHQREAKPNRSKNTRVGPPSRRRLVAIALDRAAAAAIARGINPVQHPARRRRALVLQGALAGKC